MINLSLILSPCVVAACLLAADGHQCVPSNAQQEYLI